MATQRIQQRNIVPSAVKARHLSNVIFSSNEGSAQTTLNNGDQALIRYTLTQDDEYELLGNYYIAVYIDSVNSGNQLPGGAGVDETQWQVIGPFLDYDDWNDAGLPRHKEYATIYILNISAGSRTVIFKNRWRYISPREGAA